MEVHGVRVSMDTGRNDCTLSLTVPSFVQCIHLAFTDTFFWDKKGHYIMIKGSIQEEDITIVNIYAPNIEAPQHIRQMLTAIKGEIDGNTIIMGDFNTPLTSMDRTSRQKIKRETQAFKKHIRGTSPVVQWLRLHASTAEGTCSIPGQGTKIPHAAWHNQKKIKTH